MKSLFLTVYFTFCLIHSSFSQTGVYQTYEDYKKGKLEKMDEFKKFSHGAYIFIQDGEKVKFKGEDIWGFMYDNFLFRVDHTNYHMPVYVLLIGKKIIMYENGYFQITRIVKGDYGMTFSSLPGRGYAYYLSATLKDDMIPTAIPQGIYTGQVNKLKNFIATHPEYNSIFQCMSNAHYDKLPVCVDEFEALK